MKYERERVLILASSAPSLQNFRGPMIVEMSSRGHEIHVVAPDLSSDTAVVDWLQAQGVTGHDVPLSRAGINPMVDMWTLFPRSQKLCL